MATRCVTDQLLLFGILVLLCLITPSRAGGTKYVTSSSVLKLLNINYNVRLHSHDIKYGSGSGQQSVTGTETKEDGNSYWLIKAPTGSNRARGEPIKCGDTIRLEHTATKKNLHSHLVPSPLSGQQEVSAYGDHKGDGDTGDHWIVKCTGDFWERSEPIELLHVDTDVYLAVSGRTYGNPISGQVEIVGGYAAQSSNTQWQAMEGLFIHPPELQSQQSIHTEL